MIVLLYEYEEIATFKITKSIHRQIHVGGCGELWVGLCLFYSRDLRSGPRFPSLDQELDLKRRVLRIFWGSDNFKANDCKANLCQTDYHCLLEQQWQRLLFLLWLSTATPQTIGLICYLNFEIKTIKIAPIINDYLILMFINAAPVVEVRTPMSSTVGSMGGFIARQRLQGLLKLLH